jgi:hypothetical protein
MYCILSHTVLFSHNLSFYLSSLVHLCHHLNIVISVFGKICLVTLFLIFTFAYTIVRYVLLTNTCVSYIPAGALGELASPGPLTKGVRKFFSSVGSIGQTVKASLRVGYINFMSSQVCSYCYNYYNCCHHRN